MSAVKCLSFKCLSLKCLPLCLLMITQALPALAGDPTRPPFAEASAPRQSTATSLQLSMILQEDGRNRAVINGSLVAVSESVGNARVVAINPDHVVMARAGRQFSLHLPIAAVKQSSQGSQYE